MCTILPLFVINKLLVESVVEIVFGTMLLILKDLNVNQPLTAIDQESQLTLKLLIMDQIAP